MAERVLDEDREINDAKLIALSQHDLTCRPSPHVLSYLHYNKRNTYLYSKHHVKSSISKDRIVFNCGGAFLQGDSTKPLDQRRIEAQHW
jgi:hypothetical protein